MRKHFPQLEPRSFKFLKNWERIYLEKEEVGFYVERRGGTKKMDNSKKGRPRMKPLDKQVENDLICLEKATVWITEQWKTFSDD